MPLVGHQDRHPISKSFLENVWRINGKNYINLKNIDQNGGGG